MEKEENKVNFDMSVLSLKELVEVHEQINEFLRSIDNKKIEEEDAG